MKEWFKKHRVDVVVFALLICLSYGVRYNEPSWWDRWVVGPINWLIDGWGNYSIYDYQSPPAAQQPPAGNQGPCPCG